MTPTAPQLTNQSTHLLPSAGEYNLDRCTQQCSTPRHYPIRHITSPKDHVPCHSHVNDEAGPSHLHWPTALTPLLAGVTSTFYHKTGAHMQRREHHHLRKRAARACYDGTRHHIPPKTLAQAPPISRPCTKKEECMHTRSRAATPLLQRR